MAAAGCGGGDDGERRTTTAAPGPAPGQDARDGEVAPPDGLALGIAEANPSFFRAGDVPAGFGAWRDRFVALRPALYRLIVDWANLQPAPGAPVAWEQSADGCIRGAGPCGPWSGIRDVLRAIRSRQEADGGGFQAVVLVYGVPEWAAGPAGGCERPDIGPRSRPITADGLRAYRRLVRSLLALAREEKVELRWWSPWNEPNAPFFISPQRPRCDPDAPTLSVAVYTRLARAMREELKAAGGDRRLIVGELAGVPGSSRNATGVGEFIDALPDDVLCGADVFAQHAYAERGREAGEAGPVGEAEAALDRRPCARDLRIWVTETGVGGARAGEEREGGDAERRADCRALHAALGRWQRDPRVDAAFQYTFRDDPAFPVGLADAGLQRTWPTYDLLRAWGGDRAPGDPEPALPPRCAKR